MVNQAHGPVSNEPPAERRRGDNPEGCVMANLSPPTPTPWLFSPIFERKKTKHRSWRTATRALLWVAGKEP